MHRYRVCELELGEYVKRVGGFSAVEIYFSGLSRKVYRDYLPDVAVEDAGGLL